MRLVILVDMTPRDRVRHLAIAAGLRGLTHLAATANVDRVGLRRILRGDVRPRGATIERLARALKCAPSVVVLALDLEPAEALPC